MIYLFVVEASLEIVPKQVRGERCIIGDAKRRGRKPRDILLNLSKHHAAVKKLGDLDRRGRPDITHLALLTALDSPLNQMGRLQIYVHTLNGEIFRLSGEVRLPRSYERFEGLTVALLRDGHVPKDPPYLLEMVDEDLPTLLKTLKLDRLIALSRVGSEVDLPRFLRSALGGRRVGFMVGGFQRGHFSPEVASLADEIIRVSPYPLSTHLAICKIFHEVERILGE
ncbi:MAG: hypothetical protein ACE5GD_05490 [Candidatus Geothermarchaeales archaeon]